MKFGLSIPPFGDFADPRFLAEAARQAEDVGWDGFFIWDHVFFDPSFHPNVSPWVGLAAVAMATARLRLGTLVTPVARRRPWTLARETVSLDRLSGGRLTLGVGLGDPVQWDFGFFHEDTDVKRRAEKLDEGLAIVTGLWTGEPFRYEGRQYQVEQVIFQPTPVQSPRIPIWVGGNWGKRQPMRRAARWDGYIPLKWEGGMTVDDWREAMAFIRAERGETTPDAAPFDWVHSGTTPGDDPARGRDAVAPFEAIGIAWWMESIDPFKTPEDWEKPWSAEFTDGMLRRIRQGPPR